MALIFFFPATSVLWEIVFLGYQVKKKKRLPSLKQDWSYFEQYLHGKEEILGIILSD